MKQLHFDCKKTFKSANGLASISRAFYESEGCAQCAYEFDDAQMQQLADTIGERIADEISEHDYQLWLNDFTISNEEERYLIEEVNWSVNAIRESTAIDMGMRYYEDMEFEEALRIHRLSQEY